MEDKLYLLLHTAVQNISSQKSLTKILNLHFTYKILEVSNAKAYVSEFMDKEFVAFFEKYGKKHSDATAMSEQKIIGEFVGQQSETIRKKLNYLTKFLAEIQENISVGEYND